MHTHEGKNGDAKEAIVL